MDIDYLLLLQNFREGIGGFLSPLMDWLTKMSVSFWPFITCCMIYWVADRRSGKRILFGFGTSLLSNGLLKLIFCVNRPWIRCDAIEPYGDAKVAATGYSFPSGHTTWATSIYGGIGIWQWKKRRWISIIAFVTMLLTMFSRNFLGVHTPQDVIVGMLSSFLMMFIACSIENWTDKNPHRDIYVMIGGLVLCVGLVIFYYLKPYPVTFKEDGSLLVDPVKMIGDSFEGIGFISSYVVCRYFERRGFGFDTEIDWKTRFVIGTFCLLPLIWWREHSCAIFTDLFNRNVGQFASFSVPVVYVMIIVPLIMKKVAASKKSQPA